MDENHWEKVFACLPRATGCFRSLKFFFFYLQWLVVIMAMAMTSSQFSSESDACSEAPGCSSPKKVCIDIFLSVSVTVSCICQNYILRHSLFLCLFSVHFLIVSFSFLSSVHLLIVFNLFYIHFLFLESRLATSKESSPGLWLKSIGWLGCSWVQ